MKATKSSLYGFPMDFFVPIIIHHFAEPMNKSVDERIFGWKVLVDAALAPEKYRVVKFMSALASYLTSRSSTSGHVPIVYRCCYPWRTADHRFPLIFEVIYYTSFTPKTIVDSFAKFDRYRYQRSGLGDPNTIKCCMDSRRFGTFTPTDLWYDCLFRTYTLKKMDALPKLLKHTNSARVSYLASP